MLKSKNVLRKIPMAGFRLKTAVHGLQGIYWFTEMSLVYKEVRTKLLVQKASPNQGRSLGFKRSFWFRQKITGSRRSHWFRTRYRCFIKKVPVLTEVTHSERGQKDNNGGFRFFFFKFLIHTHKITGLQICHWFTTGS